MSSGPWDDYAPSTAAQAPVDGPWNDYASSSAPSAAPAAPSSPHLSPNPINAAVTGLAETGMHLASGAVAPLGGGLNYLATLALTKGDTAAAQAVKDATENALTYEPRTAAGQAISGAVDSAAQAVGNAADKYIVEPASDAAARVGGPVAGAAVKTAIEGAPYLLGGIKPSLSVAGGVSDAARAGVRAIGRGAERAAETAARVEPAASAAASAAPSSAGASPASATPAPAADANVRGASAANPPTFEAAAAPSPPTEPAAATVASPDDVEQRLATLDALGLKNTRESAVTGDKKAAATDYQESKLDTEGGKHLADTFSQERDALNNFSDQLTSDAGGSTGLDETALHNRGQTILQPFEDLSDHYDARIRGLYAAADAKAKGLPLQLSNTTQVLGDRAAFIGTTEGQQLLRGVHAYLKQAGIADDTGALDGATVQQAEQFKQYLNNQWTPRTGRLIRSLKDAIDDDVTKSAGEDVYGAARGMRRARAQLLDEPKGVASLLESSGPDGINRRVNVERIPDAVVRMPVDQFSHVVDILREAALNPDIQPQAGAALNEIRSQFMLRLQEQAQKFKGHWNNRGVTQYLNQNSAKLAKVFTPAELQRLRTLNDAGNILDADRTYPGAVVQGHNLAVRGALGAIEHGAGAVGAHMGGPLGAIVGETAGRLAAKKLGGSVTRKAAQARTVDLSSPRDLARLRTKVRATAARAKAAAAATAAAQAAGIPARAMGGPVQAGQPYLVGEQGPEVVVPQQNGTVIPNHALGPTAGGNPLAAQLQAAAGAAMPPGYSSAPKMPMGTPSNADAGGPEASGVSGIGWGRN